jgi:hypothetical protein
MSPKLTSNVILSKGENHIPRTRASAGLRTVIWAAPKGGFMKRKIVSFQANARLARQLWGEPSRIALRTLRELTAKYSLSVAAGDDARG